jgi:hypothetical protein
VNAIQDLNNEANELDMFFKSSWIRSYVSVEIMAICKGEKRKAVNKSDVFSNEQKDIMSNPDAGTGISVKVRYMPENTLINNDIKDLNFTFMVDPEREAKFSGGQRHLEQYLMEHAIAKIPHESFNDKDLVAVKFTIGEDGEIIDAHVFESEYQTDRNEKIDKLLLEAVRNMPRWEPAQYANGTKIRQEFVLTVGNMDSCVINLLNIRRS